MLPTDSACTTCWGMFWNGFQTATVQNIIGKVRWRILSARRQDDSGWSGVVDGNPGPVVLLFFIEMHCLRTGSISMSDFAVSVPPQPLPRIPPSLPDGIGKEHLHLSVSCIQHSAFNIKHSALQPQGCRLAFLTANRIMGLCSVHFAKRTKTKWWIRERSMTAE